MNWNLPYWVPLTKIFSKVFFRLTIFFFRNKKFFSKKQLLFSFLCIVRQKKISEWYKIFWKFLIFKNHLVNWDPPWKISIHSDFDSLGGPLSPCGSHWLTQIRSRTLCGLGPKLKFSCLSALYFFSQNIGGMVAVMHTSKILEQYVKIWQTSLFFSFFIKLLL